MGLVERDTYGYGGAHGDLGLGNKILKERGFRDILMH